MARKLPPIQLSKLIGGVHSQEAEARGEIKLSPDRCLSALNVEEKDGYLKRRPAFHSIAHGPHFNFPAGQVVVYYGATTSYDRTISLAGSSITSGYYIYVGCDNVFDGIEIPELSITTTGFTSHGYLKVEWAFDESTWETMEGVVDFTRGRCVNGSDVWIHTLTQPGTIAWHGIHNDPETYTGGVSWGATTPSGLPASKYWVRLSIVDGAGTAKAFGSSDTLTIPQPGVHCFQLEPVTAIISGASSTGKSALFFGADRNTIRGSELGAGLSAWTTISQSPKLAFKVEDWGAGLWHDHPTLTWMRYTGLTLLSARRVWPDDFTDALVTEADWLNYTADSPSLPAANDDNNRLIRSDKGGYPAWLSDASLDAAGPRPSTQFRGGYIYSDLYPTSVTSNDTVTTNRCTMVFNPTVSMSANQLEHCFIRVSAAGSSAVAVGEESQILSNTTSQVVCYPAFSAAPETDTKFIIYKPHCKVQYGAGERVSDYLYYNFKYHLQFNPGSNTTWPFNWAQRTAGWCHFYVGREFNWSVARGGFWNSVYDPITNKHIFTNGRSGLLYWDGVRFNQLEALTDPTSARVQQYLTTAGAFDDPAESENKTNTLSETALKFAPPSGQFIATFSSKVVVAHERLVSWSVSYANRIWPNKYEQNINDPYGNMITGMDVLGNAIVIYTPTSVFASPPPDQAGMLNFQIQVTGMGFTSQRATQKLYMNNAPALLGPTADGVRIYSPGASTLTPVLEDWNQVLPEGVNLGLLHKCVGAVSKFENRYYLAVPRAGQTKLDTILVWDLSTRAWWVWRFPGEGIASIGREYDVTGNERILFGGVDGMISVLSEQDNDFGRDDTNSSIPWHATSPVLHFRGTTLAPTSMLLRCTDGDDFSVSTYINSRASADDTAAIDIDDGSSVYGTGVYNTATYSDEGEVTTKLNLATGTRCTSFQYKLHGTKRFTFKGAELLASPKGQRGKQ